MEKPRMILVAGHGVLPAHVLAALPADVLVLSEMPKEGLPDCAVVHVVALEDPDFVKQVDKRMLAMLQGIASYADRRSTPSAILPCQKGHPGTFPACWKREADEARVRSLTRRQLRRGFSTGRYAPAPRAG